MCNGFAPQFWYTKGGKGYQRWVLARKPEPTRPCHQGVLYPRDSGRGAVEVPGRLCLYQFRGFRHEEHKDVE